MAWAVSLRGQLEELIYYTYTLVDGLFCSVKLKH